ncbi:MAG: minor capsid protein [Lachnospiraceae bacterium]
MSKALYLEDVLELVKSFGIAKNLYIGKLDAKQKESIGIYNLNKAQPYRCVLGGSAGRKYDTKFVSFLVHWNKSIRETEKTAIRLFEALEQAKDIVVNEKRIEFIIPLVKEPVSVGTDEAGIFEYVIEAEIYYERIGE